MNLDWTVFRLLINSVLLTTGWLKDHKDFLTWRAFACLLPNQQRLVTLWTGIFGELRCHPHLYLEIFSGCRECGWSKLPSHQLSAEEGASPQLRLAGREVHAGYQMGISQHNFSAIAGILGHCYWPCPLPLVCWHFSGFKVFCADHNDFFHRALKAHRKCDFQLCNIPL